MVSDDWAGEFPSCTIAGCERGAGSPPHLSEGAPICKEHAIELARGQCALCGERFEPSYGGYDCYTWCNLDAPGSEYVGRALCIDCWSAGPRKQ